MKTVYYRFTHSVGDYPKLPAALRMNVMVKPGVDRASFELWLLAVLAIDGRGMSTESHERAVPQHGLTHQQVQAAVRIAAAVNTAAGALNMEAAVH